MVKTAGRSRFSSRRELEAAATGSLEGWGCKGVTVITAGALIRKVCEDCEGCKGRGGCGDSEVKGSTSDVSILFDSRGVQRSFTYPDVFVEKWGCEMWITIGKCDFQLPDLPFCESSCDCSGTPGLSLRSRIYCRRQRKKRRMNPVRTATEAMASAAMTAG